MLSHDTIGLEEQFKWHYIPDYMEIKMSQCVPQVEFQTRCLQ